MKTPNREMQERVFGYYTEEPPPENSIKAKAYELLADPLATDEQIEILVQSWKRKNAAIQENIITPLIEEQARREVKTNAGNCRQEN